MHSSAVLSSDSHGEILYETDRSVGTKTHSMLVLISNSHKKSPDREKGQQREDMYSVLVPISHNQIQMMI